MNDRTRMSPLTAFFLGLFGMGAVGIAAGASVVLYTLTIVNQQAGLLVGFASNLPEFIEALPPSISEILHDRRAPDYASQVSVKVDFVQDARYDAIKPVLKIENNGDETITMLAVRVAVLNEAGLPIHEWTEVVATPIAIDDDWRGPMMPGNPRYVVLDSVWWDENNTELGKGTPVVEIADIRIWEATDQVIKTAVASN